MLALVEVPGCFILILEKVHGHLTLGKLHREKNASTPLQVFQIGLSTTASGYSLQQFKKLQKSICGS